MPNVRWVTYHVSNDTAARFETALEYRLRRVEEQLGEGEYVGAYQVSHAVSGQGESESGVLFSAVVAVAIVRKGSVLRA